MQQHSFVMTAYKIAERIERQYHLELSDQILNMIERELKDAYDKGQSDKINELYVRQQKVMGKVLESLVK